MSIIERFNAQIRGMIADRTYHRLLHVDWIRADIDGDGVPEYVPATDRPGPCGAAVHLPALHVGGRAPEKTAKPGFYVGGNIYSDWASVPDHYKIVGGDRPNPNRSTGTIFRFTW